MPKEASKKVDQDDLGVPSTVVDVITEKVAATVSRLVGRQVAAALQEAGLSPGGGATAGSNDSGAQLWTQGDT